jgi:hypothetical protein
MNNPYDVQAKTDDLRRHIKQERLIRIAQAGRPNWATQFYEQGRLYLGQVLFWLGSRLQEIEPQPVAQNVAFGAGEAACVATECC